MNDLTRFEKISLAVVLIICLCLVGVLKYQHIAARAQIDTKEFVRIEEIKKEINTQELLVNINTASAQRLELLPGIGPVIAKRIIEYRTKNGRFKNKTELTRVKGIGTKKFKAVEGYIMVQ
ncbi:MAG: helix-hairpin-helix domain-containing protein [Candidatus Omnitrophota bacterium]